MRDEKGFLVRAVLGTAISGAIVALTIFHPLLAGTTVVALLLSLLLPPVLLALLLRAVKFRDRYATFRLVPGADSGFSAGGLRELERR